jgi:hypothetical protein
MHLQPRSGLNASGFYIRRPIEKSITQKSKNIKTSQSNYQKKDLGRFFLVNKIIKNHELICVYRILPSGVRIEFQTRSQPLGPSWNSISTRLGINQREPPPPPHSSVLLRKTDFFSPIWIDLLHFYANFKINCVKLSNFRRRVGKTRRSFNLVVIWKVNLFFLF